MLNDYKYAALVRAEELAEERFRCDYFDLPKDVQTQLYSEGLEDHWNSMADHADTLCERLKEERK